jgi:hypothetical protein
MELLTSTPFYAIIPTDKEQGRDQYDSIPDIKHSKGSSYNSAVRGLVLQVQG